MKNEIEIKFDSCPLNAKVRHVKQGFTMFIASKTSVFYGQNKRELDEYFIGLSESPTDKDVTIYEAFDKNSDFNKRIKNIPLDVFLSEWEVIK